MVKSRHFSLLLKIHYKVSRSALYLQTIFCHQDNRSESRVIMLYSNFNRSCALSWLALLVVMLFCVIALFEPWSNDASIVVTNIIQRRLTTSSSVVSSSSSLLDENKTLPPLFPLTWPSDYLGFSCATVGLLLAAGGGITW